MIRKPELNSVIQKCNENPVKTSYDLLWQEVRGPRSNLTLQNTLRRILENYFTILGGIDQDSICEKFDGKDRLVCKSLFSWVNDGSHFSGDDIFMSVPEAEIETYLRIFRDIFFVMKHEAHYKMMMGDSYIDSEEERAPA